MYVHTYLRARRSRNNLVALVASERETGVGGKGWERTPIFLSPEPPVMSLPSPGGGGEAMMAVFWGDS